MGADFPLKTLSRGGGAQLSDTFPVYALHTLRLHSNLMSKVFRMTLLFSRHSFSPIIDLNDYKTA